MYFELIKEVISCISNYIQKDCSCYEELPILE